jgi:anti-anti-sigma factor
MEEPAFASGAVEASTSRAEGRVVLALTGELDLAAHDDLERYITQLDAERPAVFLLDLRGLTFIDSSGIRLIVHERERSAARGGRFVVVHGSAFIDRLLEISGVRDLLEIVDDPAAV